MILGGAAVPIENHSDTEALVPNRPYHELEHHGICFGFGGIFKIQNGGSAL